MNLEVLNLSEINGIQFKGIIENGEVREFFYPYDMSHASVRDYQDRYYQWIRGVRQHPYTLIQREKRGTTNRLEVYRYGRNLDQNQNEAYTWQTP